MNKEYYFHIKQFLNKILKDKHGIPLHAYSEISTLMQIDKNFAMEMHEVVSNIAISNDRCFITNESCLDFDEVSEKELL